MADKKKEAKTTGNEQQFASFINSHGDVVGTLIAAAIGVALVWNVITSFLG